MSLPALQSDDSSDYILYIYTCFVLSPRTRGSDDCVLVAASVYGVFLPMDSYLPSLARKGF